jgi:cytochrome c556
LITRILIAIAAVAVGATTVIAQQENIAAKRNAVMKQSGKAFYGVIGGMNRGASPYDQAAADAAFNDLDAAAKQYVTLFPANALTAVPESNFVVTAKAAANPADVQAKAAASAKLAADYKGKVKDLDGLKAAFTAINDGCNGCHNDYRAKK